MQAPLKRTYVIKTKKLLALIDDVSPLVRSCVGVNEGGDLSVCSVLDVCKRDG